MQFSYLVNVVLNAFLFFLEVFFIFFQISGVFLDSFVFFFVFEVLLVERHIFCVNFFLELRNLVVDDFISALNFRDFILGFGEILAVEISISPDSLI
jgi:hypothetical protein